MLYFTRWKALAIILTALVGVPLRRSELLPRGDRSRPGRAGRSGISCSASTCRAAPICCSRSIPTTSRRRSSTRSATTCAARCARPRSAIPGLPCRDDAVEVRISKDTDLPTALTQAARAVAAARRPARLAAASASLEVTDAGGGLIRLTRAAGRDHSIASAQTIEQSIQIVERRVNELGTVEPLIQRQGTDRILVQVPGLQDPTALKEILGKTAKMEFRMVDTTVPPDQAQQGRVPPDSELLMSASKPPKSLRHQEAGAGLRRRPHRCAARLRPAHQRADRQLQIQHRRLAQIRAGHHRECRPALRDRARQQGDFRARDPRADHRRPGPDFRQFHRAVGQRSGDPAARRRAAGAADGHRGAHRRSGPRPGLDREGRACGLCRLDHGRSCSCW